MSANNLKPLTPSRARGINRDRGLEQPHFYRAVLGQNPCRASEVAPGHGVVAALVFPAGTSARQLASRVDGNVAGNFAASACQGQYTESLKCL